MSKADCYLAYVTANDDPDFILDFINFRNMADQNSGCAKIRLYIAVSLITPLTDKDERKLQQLLIVLEHCSSIVVEKLILKGNLGRDFSSAYVCLREISKSANDADIVMVKNRSGYGPLTNNWFSRYCDQLTSRADVGLVGSTISFVGHPKFCDTEIATHVQTYVYCSYWRHFKCLLPEFPAIHCTDRIRLIAEGEVGLSRYFLEQGMSISCLAWPDHYFTKDVPVDESLPVRDIKAESWVVDGLPIRYRFRKYRNILKRVLTRIEILKLDLLSNNEKLHCTVVDEFG